MIINNTHEFIFVHIPKSAGSSVSSFLSQYTQYCDQEIGATKFGEGVQALYSQRFGLRKHSGAHDIRDVVGRMVWARYFTFAFVRNPYRRLQSAFEFLKTWNGLPQNFKEMLEKYDEFPEFLESDLWETRPGPDGLFQPQWDWVCDRRSPAAPIVRQIFKVEQLDKEMDKLIDLARLPPPKVASSHVNKSREYEPYTKWTESQKDRVTRRYLVDFRNFNYNKEP